MKRKLRSKNKLWKTNSDADIIIVSSRGNKVNYTPIEVKLYDGPTICDTNGNVRIVASKKPNLELYTI
ncbi:hypothetical protein [Planococcus maitriensis]|uniref:Uncharacterized protein n=1 Tax=Planococcus maitriensis TaxID=221799 RepID=A0A365K420_9BACL|nr:hypothetical protein [Planococcus maitriensis]RAZ66959.1 hypothetical protein DP119_11700 [Planococcus maitriensis]